MRVLARTPGFTLAALLTLAFGLGANSAIFTVVNAVLLKPLPCADPDRRVSIYSGGAGLSWVALAEVMDYRRRLRGVDEVATWTTTPVNLAPSLRALRLDLVDALKEGGLQGTISLRRQRARAARHRRDGARRGARRRAR